MENRALDAVIAAQGTYFAATGLWALADLDSFERVTGPKTDKWLVKTVGALVAVIGGTLVGAAARRRVSGDVLTLAVGSAAALAAVDLVYATRRRIARVYLLDAVAEAGLIIGALSAHAAGGESSACSASPALPKRGTAERHTSSDASAL